MSVRTRELRQLQPSAAVASTSAPERRTTSPTRSPFSVRHTAGVAGARCMLALCSTMAAAGIGGGPAVRQ